MKGFINTPYKATENVKELLDGLRQEVEEEILGSSGKRKEDLQGVLSFLDSGNLHYSEGRSFAFDKKSFSVTEIQVASKLPDNVRIKYLLYRYHFNHYTRQARVTDFPTVLCIEPASVCNLRCTMCFQADETFTKDKKQMGIMDMALYKKIVDEAAENNLCSIVLASRGEPTLHKQLPEMISYARSKGIIDIKLNTNATRLTPELSRKLLTAFGNDWVSTVVFSVDSAEKDEFERIRVGANFDKIVENIKQFNAIRAQEFPESKLRTRISMTIVKGYIQDVQKSKDFWRDLVDEFAFHEANDRVDIYHHPPNGHTEWCGQLFERLYIWFDGTVNPCDEDYKSKLAFGNVKDASIKGIWHGEAMTRYRMLHRKQRREQLYPCDRCYRVNG